MADKVQGGTPRGITSLCVTCRAAHNVVGVNMQRVTICRIGQPVQVTFPISECSAYDDKRIPALHQMYEIAWEVKSRIRGQAGFAEPRRDMDITISPPDRVNQPGMPAATPTCGCDHREEKSDGSEVQRKG